LAFQFGARNFLLVRFGPGFGFRDKDDRRIRSGLDCSQDMLGIIQGCAREPARARHFARGKNLIGGLMKSNLKKIGNGTLETIEIGGRPIPELLVVGEFQAAGFSQPARVAGHIALGGSFGIRLPEKFAPRHRESWSFHNGPTQRFHKASRQLLSIVTHFPIDGKARALCGEERKDIEIRLVCNDDSQMSLHAWRFNITASGSSL
jgi:hypothetical protein